MRVAIAKCDEATGRIEGCSRVRADYVDQQTRQRGVVPIEIDEDLSYRLDIAETHYGRRAGGEWEVIERPDMPIVLDKTTIAADDNDAASLSEIPPGSKMSIDGAEAIDVSGDVDITSPMPATYDVLIECWPYRSWRRTITAE